MKKVNVTEGMDQITKTLIKNYSDDVFVYAYPKIHKNGFVATNEETFEEKGDIAYSSIIPTLIETEKDKLYPGIIVNTINDGFHYAAPDVDYSGLFDLGKVADPAVILNPDDLYPSAILIPINKDAIYKGSIMLNNICEDISNKLKDK